MAKGVKFPDTSGYTEGTIKTLATTDQIPAGDVAATPETIVCRNGSGAINAVSFQLCDVNTSNQNVRITYNDNQKCIEFFVN